MKSNSIKSTLCKVYVITHLLVRKINQSSNLFNYLFQHTHIQKNQIFA